MMKILGIDPGSFNCGWASIDDWSEPLDYGTLEVTKKDGHYVNDRLGPLFVKLQQLLDIQQPDFVAYESQAKGGKMNAIISHSQVIALIEVLCHLRGIRPVEISPSTAKKDLTGKSTASKEEMIAQLRSRLPEDKQLYPIAEHEADGYGVAVSALAKITANDWKTPPRPKPQPRKPKKDPNAPKKPRTPRKKKEVL